jgi:tRNA pseudouridine38-40 synthase
MRIALGVEYCGSGYCGWQTQPSGCSIQDHLELALARIADTRIATMCAGRTDAGVHALHQVVHFDTDVSRPLSAWVRGANTWLPHDIAILWAHPVDPEFHARFSAVRRRYRYVLLNHPVRAGLEHQRAGWFHMPLDVDAMRVAAASLVGEHDFSAFRSSECQARTPVRQFHSLGIERRGNYIDFDFCANGFLHHMVRNIMGCLVFIGKGREPASWMRHVLDGRDRTKGAPMFEAAGLYLSAVEYEARFGIPTLPRNPNEALGTSMMEST